METESAIATTADAEIDCPHWLALPTVDVDCFHWQLTPAPDSWPGEGLASKPAPHAAIVAGAASVRASS